MNRIILLCAMFCFGASQMLSGQSVGDDSPDFTVNLEGGGSFTLSDQEGKVVMLFFFGNSCGNCISAGPKVEELYAKYADNNQFVTVGLDTWGGSDNESVGKFRERSSVSFPLGLEADDVETAFDITYDRLAVVDQNGIIRHLGSTGARNDISTVDQVIETLLSEQTTGVEKKDMPQVQIGPNPGSDFIRFSFEEELAIRKLTVIDLTGKIMHKQDFGAQKNGEIILEIGEYKAGFFLYKLETQEGLISGRFLVR